MYDDNPARMCGYSDHWLGKNMKESADHEQPARMQNAPPRRGILVIGCLTMSYFRTGNLHYHRR